MKLNKAAQEAGIIAAIYSITANGVSGSNVWAASSLFDSKALKSLENYGIVEFNEARTYVMLTEYGVGIRLFGEDDADLIAGYL